MNNDLPSRGLYDRLLALSSPETEPRQADSLSYKSGAKQRTRVPAALPKVYFFLFKSARTQK
jgi:hypothetical protein